VAGKIFHLAEQMSKGVPLADMDVDDENAESPITVTKEIPIIDIDLEDDEENEVVETEDEMQEEPEIRECARVYSKFSSIVCHKNVVQ
jgi:hypothetical protein